MHHFSLGNYIFQQKIDQYNHEFYYYLFLLDIYLLISKNYFYYVRYFDVELINNKKLAIGSATDYSENYPDAPKYWLLNQNKEIEKIGNTNIKKYSLNFELRK